MTAPRPALPRRQVDGVLLLDKPIGISSNAALQRAKRLFAASKAGHTGTLDPLASGLLPVCFGEATKFAQPLLDARKTYLATVRFGIATATGDAEGEIVDERPIGFDRADIERVLPQFKGAIAQVPPRFAALKYRGRNYYEYARAGIDIPRPARDIHVESIEVVDWAMPVATLIVTCGKGTYIRVLAEDLAAAVGCCAHLLALRRIASGPYAMDGGIGIDALEALPLAERDALLLPVDSPLAHLPRLDLDVQHARALYEGRVVPCPASAAGRYRCIDDTGFFIGVAEIHDGGLKAVRLLRDRRSVYNNISPDDDPDCGPFPPAPLLPGN